MSGNKFFAALAGFELPRIPLCGQQRSGFFLEVTSRRLIIGSRGSDLALIQAGIVQTALQNACGLRSEIKVIRTEGDHREHLGFDQMEGRGFFTKELEDALLDQSIDLAVHSLKDLPTTQPDGLVIGAVGFRADRRELLLMLPGVRMGTGVLPIRSGGRIGTSSTRRKAQIAYDNLTLQILDLRGNVPTRIRKLRDGQYDAIIIAAAGVERLGLDMTNLDTTLLDLEDFVPAPGQGVLAIEIRNDDHDLASAVAKLNSPPVETEISAERGLLKRFGAGCSLPLGAFAVGSDTGIRLVAVLGTGNGKTWGGLKRVDVTAGSVEEVVKSAFAALTRGD
ncbi:MAG: hydroxymethylbilane synthase [Candidatus Zixiibacteriota bacterium]